MAGNVWEWCLTRWGEDSAALEGDALRVLRGGSFYSLQSFAAASSRSSFNPHYGGLNCGVRVVLGAPI